MPCIRREVCAGREVLIKQVISQNTLFYLNKKKQQETISTVIFDIHDDINY